MQKILGSASNANKTLKSTRVRITATVGKYKVSTEQNDIYDFSAWTTVVDVITEVMSLLD